MAAKWTADWENRLFILKPGVTEIDVQVDLYSDWKEEVQLSDNMKWAPAMRAVGGDPISDTQDLGSTYFLTNGWRIRPQEADHELIITGNIYTDPAGEAIVIPTVGSYTVLVTNRVSNLVDSSVARLDLTQLQPAVYIDVISGEAGTDEGIGTPTRPVNNITDARTIADRDNLREYVIVGSPITLDQDHLRWTFRGQGSSLITLGGYDVSGSHFTLVALQGTMTAPTQPVTIDESSVLNLTNFWGSIGRTIFSGVVQLAPGDTSINDCASNVPGPSSQPVFDMGGHGDHLSVRSWSGGIKLEDCVDPSMVSVDMVSGHLVLDSTCTGGTLVVRGVGKLTDNSTGTVVDHNGLVEGEEVHLTRKVLTNRLETDPTSGVLTIYDDDGSVLKTADLFENVSGSQRYRGQGAERRDKLT